MVLSLISAAVSAGSNFLGGLMNQNERENDRHAAEQNALRNIAMQKEFAQQGIRWKVDDARAAGIHPLYALGASSHSFAPVSIGGSSGGSTMGSTLASMGQDVSRAINATSTKDERVSAYSEQAARLQLDNMALQNQLLASRIKVVNQAGGNPPIPDVGPLPPIPEAKKQDDRPPLQMGGERVLTDPGTTNMQKFEDRYGDEGPVPWALQIGVAYNDLIRNYGQPATWPMQVVKAAWHRLSSEAQEEYGNVQRFSEHLRGIGPRMIQSLGRR